MIECPDMPREIHLLEASTGGEMTLRRWLLSRRRRHAHKTPYWSDHGGYRGRSCSRSR